MIRALGWLWASPLTLAGVLAAWLGSCRFLGLHDGALEWRAEIGGLAHWVFARTRTAGAAWGCCLIYDQRGLSRPVRAHERRHMAQATVLGPLWPVAYLLAGAWAACRGRGFYRGNWLEVDARRAPPRKSTDAARHGARACQGGRAGV